MISKKCINAITDYAQKRDIFALYSHMCLHHHSKTHCDGEFKKSVAVADAFREVEDACIRSVQLI